PGARVACARHDRTYPSPAIVPTPAGSHRRVPGHVVVLRDHLPGPDASDPAAIVANHRERLVDGFFDSRDPGRLWLAGAAGDSSVGGRWPPVHSAPGL